MSDFEPNGTDHDSRWLKSIRLQRFKAAFQPPSIPLQRFTVIVGRNGSGKSTLLEALQWLDASMRSDCHVACERYHGVHDIINVRSQVETRFFEIDVEWEDDEQSAAKYEASWHYGVRVEETETERGRYPFVAREYLYFGRPNTAGKKYLIASARRQRRVFSRPAVNAKGKHVLFEDPVRLALSRNLRLGEPRGERMFGVFADFWNRAVFLRLSPNRLADLAHTERRWLAPLLDEEGHDLPALLNELNQEQRDRLVAEISGILDDIVDVTVNREGESKERAYYALSERMPYRGRGGMGTFPIPSWMLSEGTRRVTAILALLEHAPPPSLLCIEEIENGLDPWTVLYVLKRLQSASTQGVQVIITTHSPWLLDHVEIGSILHVRRSDGETVYEKFSSEADVRKFASSVPPGTRFVNIAGR
ncbi:MAG TPA: ATP-binding protein [Kofleriaceae bacterium]|nr:ATP-binding protein [Kofleriaceae bacterium]